MSLKAVLFLAILPTVDAVEVRMATYNIGAHLVVPPSGPAYFDYGIGAAGAPDHDRVREVLGRIDADVVALQEIHTADVTAGDLAVLASSLNYPHVFVAPTTNAFDNSLRVVFLSRFPFLSQTAITSPPMSRDMTRLIPAVTVDVPGTSRDPLLIAAHLKSGSAAADLFQRTVEMRRLTNHLAASGKTAEDNFIVLGDFNLSGNPREFTALPGSGLPSGFNLGADIGFPISYFTEPTAYFRNPPVTRILPRQLDSSTVTFPPGTTIDLFLVSPILGQRPLRSEIYNSALDTSNSQGLPKFGLPLAPGTSAAASDHLALFADFELDPALPYAFHAPGETVSDTFADFPGTFDPYPWTTTGGTWQGAETGAASAPGFRAYGPAADPSLGFIPGAGPGTATARFVNRSATTLTALHVAYTAEQWRSAQNGSADTLNVELIQSGVPKPLPALSFTAATHLPSGPISGGAATPKSALVTGLSIAPGAEFQLKFSFAPGPGSGPLPADVFINEFHYDNSGTDSGEFVEIVTSPGFTGTPADVALILYDGADGSTYGSSHPLSTFTPGNETSSGHRFYSKAISSLQNGTPDGFALVVNGAVTQFISYEGSFAATAGPATGSSTNIGVSQAGTELAGQSSLGLTGTGGTASAFTWTKFTGLPYTAGSANTGQTFTLPFPPPQGIAIDNLAVTFVGPGDSDGDGMTDLEEFLFGSDPHDAASRYAVTLTRTAADKLKLSFRRIASSSYLLESSTDLIHWDTWKTYPGGVDSDTDVSLTISPGTPARFYRVRASVP